MIHPADSHIDILTSCAYPCYLPTWQPSEPENETECDTNPALLDSEAETAMNDNSSLLN